MIFLFLDFLQWEILQVDKALKEKPIPTREGRCVLNLFKAILCFDAWLHLPSCFLLFSRKQGEKRSCQKRYSAIN
jgi:hypothetical protein